MADDINGAVHHVLETLDYDIPCHFDHHGGCQAHGYLDEIRGCPVPILAGKEIRAFDMPKAREVAQALLDVIKVRRDHDTGAELGAYTGAELMACILLGSNWNGKLD